MLNRRFLRVKVLQSLYAFFQLNDKELSVVEKNMFHSINKVFDLYLLMIDLLLQIAHEARLTIDRNKNKNLPTSEDLNPNTKFVDNRIIAILEQNQELKNEIEKRKISWINNAGQVTRLWKVIKDSDEYQKLLNEPENSFNHDKKFLITIYDKFIADNESLQSLLHEQSIYWYTDIEMVNLNIVKTIQGIKEETKPYTNVLLPLYKDAEDDQKFIRELLRKTIQFDPDYSKEIALKTKNWDIERVAVIDIILMKMALCEFQHFSGIPIKVTLNEYIDLSKAFSTPRSKNFVNGILDRFVIEWKEAGKIAKTGRGLM